MTHGWQGEGPRLEDAIDVAQRRRGTPDSSSRRSPGTERWTGPTSRCTNAWPTLTERPIIASGGVRVAADVWALRELGIEAVVVGKAMYSGTLADGGGGARVTLAKRILPCLDVDAGRVVKGTRFVDLRRRRRSGGARGALRRGGRGRARVPRHHGDGRGTAGDARRDRADRRPGLHPAHGRRRRSRGRGRANAPARRRRQGRDQQRRGSRALAARPLRRAVRDAVHRHRDRREAAQRRRLGGLRRRGPNADRPGRRRVGRRGHRDVRGAARSC